MKSYTTCYTVDLHYYAIDGTDKHIIKSFEKKEDVQSVIRYILHKNTHCISITVRKLAMQKVFLGQMYTTFYFESM